MLDWKGYDEEDPKVLVTNISGLKIIIHKIRDYDGLYVDCYRLNIENRPLRSIHLEDAKAESIQIVIDNISELEKVKETLNKSNI